MLNVLRMQFVCEVFVSGNHDVVRCIICAVCVSCWVFLGGTKCYLICIQRVWLTLCMHGATCLWVCCMADASQLCASEQRLPLGQTSMAGRGFRWPWATTGFLCFGQDPPRKVGGSKSRGLGFVQQPFSILACWRVASFKTLLVQFFALLVSSQGVGEFLTGPAQSELAVQGALAN